MITPSPIPTTAASGWQRALSEAVRDPDVLIDLLKLPESYREPARRAAKLFPLVAPRGYVDRMRPGDPDDPLLKQVLPLGLEQASTPGFTNDPVGDTSAKRAPGLLQKYAGRALLIASGTCAVHCRYCFRRHYPYAEEPRRLADWEPAFRALSTDSSVHEVIFSGGDPWLLTDRRLGELRERLDDIPHICRARFHTRLPIVIPERVTPGLLDVLTGGRVTPIVVVHANHRQELRGACGESLRRLVREGVTVLNQSVLLRGINDSADALAELCEGLIDLGVLPYYLHQLDRVTGTAHFEVDVEHGRALIAELRRRLPGYAIPQYVQEVAGELHKLPL